ncbi:MAG: response regulator [Candidatus Sumerlaeia bacterium]|nr:response regulator [Candidatus Sumerlaeia bacterium]
MKRRILVIDDEHRLAKSLCALLRGVGYDVSSAIGGVAGLEALCSEQYDLVITDVRMPDIDGFEIIRYLEAHCPRTPVIVITGHASTESAIEAIHRHVADYIPKPFDFELLKASVEKVFARQEVEQLKEDMSRMFSHDIKVPVTTIIGFADFLLREDGTLHPRAPEYAAKIRSNSRKILALIENYLTSSRVDEGRFELSPAAIDLCDVVSDALSMVSPEFEAKGMKCRAELPKTALIEADEALLFRAVSNLLSNAAKYGPEGAEVWVRVEACDAGRWRVVVGNTGSCVPEDEAARVFQRYRRASNAGAHGHGLGLHIVQIAAKAHGGTTACIPAPDGASVEFELRVASIPRR